MALDPPGPAQEVGPQVSRSEWPALSGMARLTLETTRARIPAGLRGPIVPGDRVKLGLVDITVQMGWREAHAPAGDGSTLALALYPLPAFVAREWALRQQLQQPACDRNGLLEALNYLLTTFWETNVQQNWRVELGRAVTDLGWQPDAELWAIGRGDHLLFIDQPTQRRIAAQMEETGLIERASGYIAGI